MKAVFPAGSLPEGLQESIEARSRALPFAIFWEVRTLLYLGVVSLSAGLGILVYKNIESIGHQTILALIALLTGLCFWYCAKRAAPFTTGKLEAPSSWADYVLLLGVLLFGTFTGYLQFQYSVFGSHHDLAVAMPSLFYLFLAYRFDHRGVLQLAITGLCATVGVALTPAEAFRGNLWDSGTHIHTTLAVAAALAAAGWFFHSRAVKPHFTFSYLNFAVHLAMLAALAGMFSERGPAEWAYVLLLAGLTAVLWKYARQARSAYFLLLAVGYGYIAVTSVIMRHLLSSIGSGGVLIIYLYFFLSCGGAIYLFLNLKDLAGSGDAGPEPRGKGGHVGV